MKATRHSSKLKWVAGLATVGATGTVVAAASFDFGLFRDQMLEAKSNQAFGVVRGIAHSSGASIDAATANADPTALVTMASGLKVGVVSAAANLGANIDQMALWPNDQNPDAPHRLQRAGPTEPGVQRIRVSRRRGRDDRDRHQLPATRCAAPPGARSSSARRPAADRTAAQMYEIHRPARTPQALCSTASTGTFSNGRTGAAPRTAPPAGRSGGSRSRVSRCFRNGLVYYGDENRPANGDARAAPTSSSCPTLPIPAVHPSPAWQPVAARVGHGVRAAPRAASGHDRFGQGTQYRPASGCDPQRHSNADLRALVRGAS